jgi:hypothetical protein
MYTAKSNIAIAVVISCLILPNFSQIADLAIAALVSCLIKFNPRKISLYRVGRKQLLTWL